MRYGDLTPKQLRDIYVTGTPETRCGIRRAERLISRSQTECWSAMRYPLWKASLERLLCGRLRGWHVDERRGAAFHRNHQP